MLIVLTLQVHPAPTKHIGLRERGVVGPVEGESAVVSSHHIPWQACAAVAGRWASRGSALQGHVRGQGRSCNGSRT